MAYRPTIALDLDGTLATYNGWLGVDHIGAPITGAAEFTKRLSEFADVLIYTTRCSTGPNRQDVLDKHPELTTQAKLAAHLAGLVKTWLDTHGFTYADIWTGQGKPLAAAIVDDRAIACVPQAPGANPYQTYANVLNAARHLCEKK